MRRPVRHRGAPPGRGRRPALRTWQGFDFLLTGVVNGWHTVCVYALNISLGTGNPRLGCRDVPVNRREQDRPASWPDESGELPGQVTRVLSFPQHAVPPALQVQVVALQDQAWPREPGEPSTDHDPALQPVTMLLVDDRGSRAGLAGHPVQGDHPRRPALRRQRAQRRRHRAVAPQTWLWPPSGHRGPGTDRRQRSGPGHLQLRPGPGLFYRRAGWRILPGTVLIGGTPENPFPSDRFDKVVLAGLFTDHAREHAASFDQARIELYPGEIDRLW